MFKQFILGVLITGICLTLSSRAADIIWITESYDLDLNGIQDDQEWIDWLTAEGYPLDVQRNNWMVLDTGKIEALNSADLVIISRATNSGNYDEEGEADQWNSITAPMLSTNVYLARSSRWLWMDTTAYIREVGSPPLEAVDAEHAVFFGVPLDENNQVVAYDDTIGSGDTTFMNFLDVGNGSLIATVAGEEWTAIAEWDEGVEYYDGADQFAGGRRLLFSSGTQEVDATPQGALNLTADGRKMFLNAVRYMLGESLGEPGKVYGPNPRNEAIDVSRDIVLNWRSGRYTDKHDIYFGTNPEDVNDADITDTTGIYRGTQDMDDTDYRPTESPLQWDQTYYWRIDEVNDMNPNSPWKGDIWSFTVLNFIVIEDFEDYNDYPPDEIWNVWIDGFEDPRNGSTAGYPDPDFNFGEHYMEMDIVHGGAQSMPLFYDNAAGLSEVTRNFSGSLRDWTQEDIITLSLWYYGDSANSNEPMYIALNGNTVVTNDDADAALRTEWTTWEIPLQDFADQGINLANINSMSIGFGDKNNPLAGGSGHVFFDDIRLYR